MRGCPRWARGSTRFTARRTLQRSTLAPFSGVVFPVEELEYASLLAPLSSSRSHSPHATRGREVRVDQGSSPRTPRERRSMRCSPRCLPSIRIAPPRAPRERCARHCRPHRFTTLPTQALPDAHSPGAVSRCGLALGHTHVATCSAPAGNDTVDRLLQQTQDVSTSTRSSFLARALAKPVTLPGPLLPETRSCEQRAGTLASTHTPAERSESRNRAHEPDRAPARRRPDIHCHRSATAGCGASQQVTPRPKTHYPRLLPRRSRRVQSIWMPSIVGTNAHAWITPDATTGRSPTVATRHEEHCVPREGAPTPLSPPRNPCSLTRARVQGSSAREPVVRY